METGEGRSSSNDLSSAPNSDVEGPFPPSITSTPLAEESRVHHDDSTIVVQGANNVGVANPGGRSAAPATPSDSRQEPTQQKAIRRPRKKKELQLGDAEKEKKDKPARKPRAAPGTAAAARKRPKLEHANDKPDSKASTPLPEESRIAKSHTLSSSLLNSASEPASVIGMNEAAKHISQFGFTRQDPVYDPPKSTISQEPKTMEVQSHFTPRSAGIYDPVRSITTQRPPEPIRPIPTPQPAHTTPPRPLNTASASPAISSIIDPPVMTAYPTLPSVPENLRSGEGRTESLDVSQEKFVGGAMDIDPPTSAQIGLRNPPEIKKPLSDAPSNAPSPKPPRAKEQPPPLPQGSGLLSSTLFGGDAKSEGQAAGDVGPNIILHIDLKGRNNQVINFARMAEEKYGFAALYPRQAAQKERLARIAAAGAALERSASSSKLGGSAGESGDEDVSVDSDRDSENDGDVMMSGINGGNETGANSGTDGAAAPKRRRRRKIEEYDQEDPFVDDSELIWEAQAAASKDGFFVYCGPLVPEGEKPAVERADGTVKRGRGRGRGGGVGSRGGRGAHSASTMSEAGVGRGGGPGSRGGTTTRKPRITKADRAMMEKEKANREKMATLAAKPPGYPS